MAAGKTRDSIPFDVINGVALEYLRSLVPQWFPNGHQAGHEWRVGSINGEAGESFSINLQTGKWAEFNGLGEAGGDVIGLCAAKFYHGDRMRAALALADMFGIEIKRRARPKPKPKTTPGPLDQKWSPMIPPPPDAGPPPDAMLAGFDMLHRYTSLDGRETHYVGRIEARGDKRKQFVPITYGELNGVRGWHKKAPDPPRPLYGLNKLTAKPDASVILCEGEKAADAAQRLFPDHACISWFGGTAQVERADLSLFANRVVIVWPDADEPGLNAMRKLTSRLPADTQVVHTDGLPERFDAADLEHQGCDDPAAWLNGRLTPAGEICSDRPSGDAAEPSAPDDDAELERLARLPLLEYGRARKELAKRLGVPLDILDRAVRSKRAELGLDAGDDGKQGQAISFPEPEPWPQPVDGAELLDDIAKAIRRHVVMHDHACDTDALWAAHTYLLDHTMITPRLAIRSAVKGCGKTPCSMFSHRSSIARCRRPIARQAASSGWWKGIGRAC